MVKLPRPGLSALDKKIVQILTFSSFDLLSYQMVKLIGDIIIINLLPREVIGAVGIAVSYVAILDYFFLAPEEKLYKDYPQIKNNKAKRDNELSGLLTYHFFKNFLALLVAIPATIYLYETSPLIALAFAALLLQKLSQTIRDYIKLVFYVDFQAGFVSKIVLFNNVIFFGFIAVLFLNPTLLTYLIAITVSEIIALVIWMVLLKRKFDFDYKYSNNWIQIINSNLIDFSLWNHLNNVSTTVLHSLSTIILSQYADLITIGNFTIAIKISKIPMMFGNLTQNSMVIHFGNKMKAAERTLSKYITIYGLAAVAQFVLFVLVGKQLTRILFTKEYLDEVFFLSTILVGSVSLLLAARPFIAFQIAKLPMKSATLNVFLPFVIFGVIALIYGVNYYGAIGVALSIAASYLLLVILSSRFVFSRV